MDILIVGMGYVGTTVGLVLADQGHTVIGFDVDEHKIKLLNKGQLYFYEPGVDELLKKNLANDRVAFTTDIKTSLQKSTVIFICVGTPAAADGHADLTYVEQAAQMIGKYMNGHKVIIIKSTVPIGTHGKVKDWIQQAQARRSPFDVVSNPEFLREGSALQDALHPDRIVIGCETEQATSLMRQLYAYMSSPIIKTTPKAAELIKYASNSFLAMKISFINELAKLCDQLGINVSDIAKGIGMDPRINPYFLKAGIGYGGSCFPKDISALLNSARQNGVTFHLLNEVVKVNQNQYMYFVQKVLERLGTLKNKKIALFGLSFKPYTDDTRESPSMYVLKELLAHHAYVYVHDPVVKLSQDIVNHRLVQCDSPEQAAEKAEAILICTDWQQYTQLNWQKIKEHMKTPNVFDGRNMLDATKMKKIGFHYQGVGQA